FGHRRLAVLDTSHDADQPMVDSSGAYVIVYNGEIYNFQELREILESRGARFRTRSDTETLLAGYQEWGVDVLDRLNGMFAFAIWDKPRQRLFLARDRLGEKPLYLCPTPDGGLIFASELRALKASGLLSGRIDKAALSHYLSLGYTLSSQPIYERVVAVEPASFWEISRGGGTVKRRYWDLAAAFRAKTSVTDSAKMAGQVDEIFSQAVSQRMVSDVPLGAFLSGGIDSSAVVAAMGRSRSPAMNHTFSIGFPQKGFSELKEARFASRFLDVNHHDLVVDDELATALPEIVAATDAPFADTSMIPTYFLARFTRQNVTVALSGDGGDEIFAGYETYLADKIHRWMSPFRSVTRPALALAASMMPVRFSKVGLDFKLKQFLRGLDAPFELAHYRWRELFDEEGKASLLTAPVAESILGHSPYDRFKSFYDEVKDLHYIDQALYVDLKTWLPDDILVKVDRMTMAHSLESRAPFLDHRLVELAASLPADVKLSMWRKKWIFKLSQRPHLPASIISRRKRGFNAPVSHWLNQSLNRHRELMYDVSLPGGERLFRSEALDTLWKEHESRQADHGFQLFCLLCLSLWLEI
ncbi:MAG: asparagine synthase (glutamine-hydrolyzing), partial [Nitrospinota bacterium]|nr:asparagine synthase (glutamine-hydrolyzing) [Nitrospinota bacterium]